MAPETDGLGVDSIDLIAQLRANPQIAARIALQSESVTALYEEAQAAPVGGAPAAADAEERQKALMNHLGELASTQRDLRCQLLDLDLRIFRNLTSVPTSDSEDACHDDPKAADGPPAAAKPDENVSGAGVVKIVSVVLGTSGGHFFGQLMTVLLLSLGGPFWYGMIGKLVGFRSVAAGKKATT